MGKNGEENQWLQPEIETVNWPEMGCTSGLEVVDTRNGKPTPDGVWTTNVGLKSYSFKKLLCDFRRKNEYIMCSFEILKTLKINSVKAILVNPLHVHKESTIMIHSNVFHNLKLT